MTDIQLRDENGKNRVIIQDYELKKVMEYAKNWATISNNELRNRGVLDNVEIVERWLKRLSSREEDDKGVIK